MIPHEVVGRTKPTTRTLDYLQDQSGPAARGLQNLASAITELGGALQAKNEKAQRFQAMQGFSQLETNASVKLTELNRAVDPADTSYQERADATFDNLATDFLKTVPPEQLAEYQARVEDLRGRVKLESLKFDYNQKDEFFRTGINDSVTGGLNSITDDWSEENVVAQEKKIQESILASDLPQAEKLELLRKTGVVVRQRQYQRAMEQNNLDGKPVQMGKNLVPGGDRGKQLAFVWHELNNEEKQSLTNLKNAKTLDQAVAAAIGYERPAGWTPQWPQGGHGFKERLNNARKVLAGTATAEAMQARAYFEQQGFTPEQASGLVGNLMQESGQHLDPAAMRENDAGPGNHSMGIGQWNRERLARMQEFTGASGDVNLPDGVGLALDDDPRFAGIPFDQREAIKADAMKFRKAQFDAEEDARTAAHDKYMDDFRTGIMKGELGEKDMLAALDSGRVDYDDFVKLDEARKRWEEKNTTLGEAKENLVGGLPLSEAQGNAYAEDQKWAPRLMQGDRAATGEVVSVAKRVGSVPPVVSNLLGSMIYHSDPAKSLFAYQTLSQIYDADATRSFQKLPEDVQDNVRAYRELRQSMNDMQVIERLRGGSSPAEMQEMSQMRVAANNLYTGQAKGAEEAQKAINGLTNGYFWDAELPANDAAEYQFHQWYQVAWVENYIKTRNPESATKLTNEAAASVWTVSNVSDFPTLMRHSPESVGYRQYEGSFDWMKKQAREQLRLAEGEKFQIFPDELTRTQVANWKAGGMKPYDAIEMAQGEINQLFGTHFTVNPPTPTWAVIRFDKDGVPRKTDERVTFMETGEMDKREVAIQQFGDLERKVEDAWQNVVDERSAAIVEKREADPRVMEVYQTLRDQYQKSAKETYPESKAYQPIPDTPRVKAIKEGERKPSEPGPGFSGVPSVKELREQWELPQFPNLRPAYRVPGIPERKFTKEQIESAKRRWMLKTDEEAIEKLRKNVR